jgi:glutamine cyclotransferase
VRRVGLLLLGAAPCACDRGGATPRRDTTRATGAAAAEAPDASVPTRRAVVVRSYPHDTSAFTEGLFVRDGELYEGTGDPDSTGASDDRRVELATGVVRQRRALPAPYFGEGIAAVGAVLYQLTWKHGKAFTYDARTLAPRAQTFSYPGEGWGLTTDGASLVMSDGSARIRFLDPKTFAVRRTIDVHDGASPVSQLNELEWVRGDILANVWQSEQIVRIDPRDGAVKAWIDLTGILPASERTGHEDVLNGIAYDSSAGRLFVTGKRWPRLFEIRVDDR